MNDPQTTKMLQAILSGQTAVKQELSGKIDKLDKKVDKLRTELKTEIKEAKKDLTERIDSLGKSLAYLEDDAPTREEFDKLERRVDALSPTL